jgi:mRNA-degrading endonuclease RelE of RelBE toxin-antitoxin system
MPYKLYTTPRFERAFKKFPPHIQTFLKAESLQLADQPTLGKRLQGRLSHLYSLHASYKGTHYRVVYTMNTDEQFIDLIYAATRENFYKEVEKAA